eukprot:CAMPEP_0198218980 /NCGR_PEP_ID=MMETSP1445-20131203/72158_1 /TAXON_ID=36898 /ORGANISM="Pyramimonas sp., Strain CCMP2087" /LENGTH=290 /DNA_ID=CAMNT_0043896251 /DNA_START=48 /DNA_END=922 /DNA_ORIENTATION=+
MSCSSEKSTQLNDRESTECTNVEALGEDNKKRKGGRHTTWYFELGRDRELALLDACARLNPFAVRHGRIAHVWEDIAKELNAKETFGPMNVTVSSRSCQNRAMKLIMEWVSLDRVEQTSLSAARNGKGTAEYQEVIDKVCHMFRCAENATMEKNETTTKARIITTTTGAEGKGVKANAVRGLGLANNNTNEAMSDDEAGSGEKKEDPPDQPPGSSLKREKRSNSDLMDSVLAQLVALREADKAQQQETKRIRFELESGTLAVKEMILALQAQQAAGDASTEYHPDGIVIS